MIPDPVITRKTARKAAARFLAAAFVRHFLLALGIALAASAAWILAVRMNLLPFTSGTLVTVLALFPLLALAGALVATWMGRRPLQWAATDLDQTLQLRDRLSTALQLADLAVKRPFSPFAVVAVEDAEQAASGIPVSKAVPIRIGRRWIWPAAGLILAFAAWMTPQVLGPRDQGPRHSEKAVRLEASRAVTQAADSTRQLIAEVPLDEAITSEAGRRLADLDRITKELESGTASAPGGRQAEEAVAKSARSINELADRVRSASEEQGQVADEARRRLAEAARRNTTRSESGRSDESPAEALRRAMREGDLETAREAARELARAVESLDELGRETLADELRRIAGELEGEPQVPPPGRARGPEATDDTADLPEGSRADDRAANAAESSPKDPRDTVPANRPEKIDDRPEVASTPDPAQPPAGERMKGSDERPPSDGKRDPEVNPTPADPPDSAPRGEPEPAPRKDPSPGQAPSQVPPRPSPDTDATPRDQRPADTGESNDREKLAPRESSAKRPENQADTDPDAKRSPESTASPRERGNEPARSIGEAMRQAADDLRPAPTPGESPPPAQQPRDPGMPGGKKSPQAPRDDQPQASDSASQAASSSDRQPPEGGAPVDELKNDQREAPTSPPDANTPPSDLPTDLKGLERLAREFEKLDRQRQDARRGEAVSEELRRKAEDLLRRSTPEQRRELERLAREFARDKGPVPGGANDRERPDSNAKPSLPGSNMDDNPAASDRRFGERSTRQNDTAESPDGFEQTPMDARRPGEGLDASRPVGHIPTLLGGAPGGRGGVGITQESAREAARGVERALEQQTIPSRRSELVRRVYRRLSERATTIEPTTVTAPGRDDIQDAPDAPRRR